MSSSGVEAHVTARLAAAPVRAEPFAHCVIDDVFPAEFYESIIDYWPEEQSWEPLSESGRVTPGRYEARQVVLGALQLHWELADAYLDCRVAVDDCERLQQLLRRRIEQLVPTA